MPGHRPTSPRAASRLPRPARVSCRAARALALAMALAMALALRAADGAAQGAAQGVAPDEGSFTLLRDGSRIGRENFSIRVQAGLDAPLLVAQGTVAIGRQRVTGALNADAAGLPIRYQRETRADGVVVGNLTGERAPGRFALRSRSEDGEAMREVPVPAGAVLADERFVHHLAFIIAGGRTGAVPVMSPDAPAAVTWRITGEGADSLTVDDQPVPATRLRVEDAGGGVRRVWVDTQGRLLRVQRPDGLLAVRDERPR